MPVFRSVRSYSYLLLALLLLGLAACAGGSAQLSQLPSGGTVQTPSEEPLPGQAAIDSSGNKLTLSSPALLEMPAGSEFDVVLSGDFRGEVYQGSARIAFDPAVMQPVSAERGGLLPGDMIHLAELGQTGFVPFAFTAEPGHNGIRNSAGELLRVRFRLTAPAHGARITLINEPEFLQLRDRQGQRLGFSIASETGVQQ